MQPNKIEGILENLSQNDSKSAMKVLSKEYEKNGKKIQKDVMSLFEYQMLKATVLAYMGKVKESSAELDNALTSFAEAKKKAGKNENLKDVYKFAKQLIIMIGIAEGSFTIASNPHYQKLTAAFAKINETVKSKELTQLIHFMHLHSNNYQQVGATAQTLALQFKLPKEYSLTSVEASYLQSVHDENAMPLLIDMAEMFAAKYEKDGHLEKWLKDSNGNTPQFFVDLTFKLKMAKFTKSADPAKFDDAMKYLGEKKSSFGIELDYQKQWISSQLHFRHVLEEKGTAPDNKWFETILKELFLILKTNYTAKLFQSIFTFHELAISLVLEYLKTNGVQLSTVAADALNKAIGSKDEAFLSDKITADLGLLEHLAASFALFEDHGVENGEVKDKSTSAHNCRKFSMLTKMYLCHKLIHVYGCSGLSSIIKENFAKYAEQYIELTSSVTDLQMYALYLSAEERKEIIDQLQKAVDAKATPARKAKGSIVLNKIQAIFREFHPKSLDELKQTLSPLVAQFFEFVQLDDKPEKGERKFSDEQALLISEIIDGFLEHHCTNQEEMKQVELFKISLLEIAYTKSNYNFDTQLALLKSFDRLGLSTSFSESYGTLGIKGAQLESLGYLHVRNALTQAYFNTFSSVTLKTNKYLYHNANDLTSMKLKAIEDFNFGQLENFIEFEGYIDRSYFMRIQFGLVEKVRGLFNQFVNTQADKSSDTATQVEIYDHGYSFEQQKANLEALITKKTVRTLDTRQITPQFQPLGGQYDQIVAESKKQNLIAGLEKYDPIDPITRFTGLGDFVSAFFKQERKSNYKKGAWEALGVFEHQFNFHQFFRLFTLQGTFFSEQLKAKANKTMEAEAILDFAMQSQKDFLQFLEDSKVEEDKSNFQNPQAQKTLKQIYELGNDFFQLACTALAIKKEERPGPEVATEILKECGEKVADLKKKTAELTSEWLAFGKPSEDDLQSKKEIQISKQYECLSLQILIFGSYFPILLELVSDSLKSAVPNMKKKKDAAFDDLKSQVIKPMKEIVNIFRDYFGAASNEAFFSASQQPKDWIAAVDEEAFKAMAAGDSSAQIIDYCKSQRLKQVNNEVRASVERMRDLTDKLSKKYGWLAGVLKGFSV